MTDSATHPEEAPEIPECRLELPALRAQRDRYRASERHLESIERRPCRLDPRFAPRRRRRAGARGGRGERECCPVFSLDCDRSRRWLAITVQNPAHDPALDALHHALIDTAFANHIQR